MAIRYEVVFQRLLDWLEQNADNDHTRRWLRDQMYLIRDEETLVEGPRRVFIVFSVTLNAPVIAFWTKDECDRWFAKHGAEPTAENRWVWANEEMERGEVYRLFQIDGSYL